MPGAEIQANAIWTALHGDPLAQRPGWVRVLDRPRWPRSPPCVGTLGPIEAR